MAMGGAVNETVAGDAANQQVPLDASRAAFLLVHGQEAFVAALAKGDHFSASTSTESALSENASSNGGASPRVLEGVDLPASANSKQVSPTGGSFDRQYRAFAGGNFAAQLPKKPSRRGNRRRRTYQEIASYSFQSDSGDAASVDPHEVATSEWRDVVTVNDLCFSSDMSGAPACSYATPTISMADASSQVDTGAWANAPSPVSPSCCVRQGSSGIVSTDPLMGSLLPKAVPEASARSAGFSAVASRRSLTQAGPPQLDACAFEVATVTARTPLAAEVMPISPCKGLATPLGIVSTTPCNNKIADASARTPVGARGPFLGSPPGASAPHLLQQAAMSIGAVTLASPHSRNVIGQAPSPNSNLSTSQHQAGAVSTVASSSVEETMRSLLAQGGLLAGGDLTAQLIAAAPEAYED